MHGEDRIFTRAVVFPGVLRIRPSEDKMEFVFPAMKSGDKNKYHRLPVPGRGYGGNPVKILNQLRPQMMGDAVPAENSVYAIIIGKAFQPGTDNTVLVVFSRFNGGGGEVNKK
jgi:hypothetical protein